MRLAFERAPLKLSIMSIEFHCQECGKLLRTPDESAGKQAACPQCGTKTPVPMQSTTDPATPSSVAPGPYGSSNDLFPSEPQKINPYATVGTPSQPYAAPPGELVHSQLDFSQTMSQTWEFFIGNIGPLALLGLVIFAINMGLQILGQIAGVAAQATQEGAIVAAVGVVNSLLNVVIQTYISLGSAVYMLKMLRMRRAAIGDLFAAGPYFLRGLGLMILFGLAAAMLLAVCMIPAGIALAIDQTAAVVAAIVGAPIFLIVGLWLWLRFGILSFYFVIDRDMGIMDALASSSRFMEGNKLTTALILLVVSLLGGVFICVTCTFGQILYIPYFALLLAAIYLTATGQPWMHGAAERPATFVR